MINDIDLDKIQKKTHKGNWVDKNKIKLNAIDWLTKKMVKRENRARAMTDKPNDGAKGDWGTPFLSFENFNS